MAPHEAAKLLVIPWGPMGLSPYVTKEQGFDSYTH